MGYANDGKSIDYDEALARLRRIAVSHDVVRSNPVSRLADVATKSDRCRFLPSGQTEELPLAGLIGKQCSVTVLAPFQTPAIDSAAMDGYAVSSASTPHVSATQPLRLRVTGTMAAGDQWLRAAQNHNMDTEDSSSVCVEIMTGAPFPRKTHPSLDGIVKVEDVVDVVPESGSSVGFCERFIEIRTPVAQAQHLRPAGTDFKKGDRVISAGETIEARHVMALASLGYTSVNASALSNNTPGMADCPGLVMRCSSPKIGVLSTGSELVDIRTKQSSGVQRGLIDDTQLFDSNGPYLVHALRARHAVKVHYLGTVNDQIKLIQQRIIDAIDDLGIDLLIMTGGVSKGRFDLTRQIIEECFNGQVVFHGVRMRPGAPALFATIELGLDHSKRRPRKVAVFGLPGNPLAAAAGLQFFVRPYLDMLEGLSTGDLGDLLRNQCLREDLPGFCTARIVMPSHKEKTKPDALVVFWLARRYIVSLSSGERMLVAEVFDDQASYKVNVLAKSNCWVIVPAGITAVVDGSLLDTVSL